MSFVQEHLVLITSYLEKNADQPSFWVSAAFAVFIALFLWNTIQRLFGGERTVIDLDAPEPCGDITLETLKKFDGNTPFTPIYFAVRGKVYDVSKGRDFYGRGGGYHVFAGKEVARALALMSLDEKDCNNDLTGLTETQLKTLEEWENKFASKYGVVGQVVPPKALSLEELAQYNGTDPDKPIYLAIQGVVYDVTKGKMYYGPDGVYPFGGRECARALAKMSTEMEDCTDHLEGLGAMEIDTLRQWEGTFYGKYNVVGTVVKK